MGTVWGWAIGLALLVGGAVLIDLALRRAGLHAFPLFISDTAGGYCTRPDQAGTFRNRCRWAFDAQGYRAVCGGTAAAGATLLVGDSVIGGGMWLHQDETVAARLAALSGVPAYPVACEGWALANGLAALPALPDWQSARRLVLVVNAGDLDTTGTADRASTPLSRAPWLAPWLVWRQAYRRGWTPAGRALERQYSAGPDAALRARNLAQLAQLAREYSGPVFIVCYPMKDAPPPDPAYCEALAAASGAALVDVGSVQTWNVDCYRDHIHPNAVGAAALAAIIFERCR